MRPAGRHRAPRRRRRVGPVVSALAVAVLTFASVAVLVAATSSPRQRAQGAAAGPAGSRGPVASTSAQAFTWAAGVQHHGAAAARPSAPRPTSLRIPAIGVRAEIEKLHLGRAGRLRSPRDPSNAGWWSGGPVPGGLGAAVLAGHLDSRTGPALFWRLARLRTGDVVRVRLSDRRTVAFRVERVRVFSAAAFPTRLVYGPTPDRALRLITCGGSYDEANGHYRDNVVVFASAVSPSGGP